MNQIRFCQYCGTTLQPDWQFCENCGNQVPQNPSMEAAPTVMHAPVKPPVAPTAPKAAAKKKRSFLWLLPVGIGCLGLICICGLIAIFLYNLQNPFSDFSWTTPTSIPEIVAAPTEAPPQPTETPMETTIPEPPDLPAPTEAPPTVEEPPPTSEPTIEENPLTGNQYRDGVSIFDDFSSKALEWPEYDDGVTILQYEQEAYSFQVTALDFFDWAYAPVDFWPNAIQFDVWGLPGPQNGTFGVFCQYQDIDNYYFVEIDLETDEFVMGQYLAGEYVPLTTPNENGQYWLSADPLKPNPNDVNRIDLSCSQEFMVLAINDALVYHVTIPDPFPNPGEMALFVYTFDFAGPEGYKVFFDNVGVQQTLQ
jgi:hypothetical protein